MSSSLCAWTKVWSQANTKGTYAFQKGRLERAQDKISHFNQIGITFEQGENVLEAGCGDGAVIISLQKLFKVKGYGVDFAPSAKQQAYCLMQEESQNFQFVLSDIRVLPFAENSFDKIVCLGVVEHMKDPVEPIRELYRVLKPGGHAVIMTPNFYSCGVLDRIVQEYFGYWKMGYQKEFSPQKLSSFVEQAGFKKPLMYAVTRGILPKDSNFRKYASLVDLILNRFFISWGFYSYTVAIKEK